MSELRTEFRPIDRLAHDRALHYLARVDHYDLTVIETADLLEVVQGYSGTYDEEGAKRGLEWMRAIDRREGRTPKF